MPKAVADMTTAERLKSLGLSYRYDGHPHGNMIFEADGTEIGRFHVAEANKLCDERAALSQAGA